MYIGHPRALPLSPDVVGQIKQIAKGIRAGEFAPLVGAGISMDSGLPEWKPLIQRLIHHSYTHNPKAQEVAADATAYFELIGLTFAYDHLAIASFLRTEFERASHWYSRAWSRRELKPFSELLHDALYKDDLGNRFEPQPNQYHRHLVALFHQEPGKIWTTNYDDLFEVAASDIDLPVRPLTPDSRTENRHLLIAHVHGFVPPSARHYPELGTHETGIILAEDDYYQVSNNTLSWTNREYYRLFDEHRVLILGMSLADPNLRRVLYETSKQARHRREYRTRQPGDRTTHRNGATHFAVMQPIGPEILKLAERIDPASLEAASRCRRDYWLKRGVELVELPNYRALRPFLTRLRHESYGSESDRAGALWRVGLRACHDMCPWDEWTQKFMAKELGRDLDKLRSDFLSDDIVEMVVFLLKNESTIELTFRAGSEAQAKKTGTLRMSVDLNDPQGVAGYVFVTGEFVRIPRTDPLFNYRMDTSKFRPGAATDYEGVIAAPIVDWGNGGLPLGVVCVTTSTLDGPLFRLPERTTVPGEKSLEDAIGWITTLVRDVLQTVLAHHRKPH